MIFVLDDTHFADVIVYNGVAGIGPYGPVHILGFSAGVMSQHMDRANAIVIPIPTAQAMSDSNILSLAACPDIFQRLRREMLFHGYMPAQATVPSPWPQAEVREGAYSVFFIRNIEDAIREFARLTLRHRIVRDKYQKNVERILAWNPGQTLAVCCFNNSQRRAPVPHLWWYLPNDARYLRVPSWPTNLTTLSQGPDCTARVEQTMIVGVRDEPLVMSSLPIGSAHSDNPASVQALFPERVFGMYHTDIGRQRDVWCKVSDVQSRHFSTRCFHPPIAP